MDNELKGAAAITHGINEYGGNKGMQEGLKKMTIDSRRAGQQEGFQQGVNYALQNLSLLERVLGHRIKR